MNHHQQQQRQQRPRSDRSSKRKTNSRSTMPSIGREAAPAHLLRRHHHQLLPRGAPWLVRALPSTNKLACPPAAALQLHHRRRLLALPWICSSRQWARARGQTLRADSMGIRVDCLSRCGKGIGCSWRIVFLLPPACLRVCVCDPQPSFPFFFFFLLLCWCDWCQFARTADGWRQQRLLFRLRRWRRSSRCCGRREEDHRWGRWARLPFSVNFVFLSQMFRTNQHRFSINLLGKTS
jgi:hypothetical protein